LVSSFTQAEPLSNCGYGSQTVYVPDAADEEDLDPDEDEHAVAAPAIKARAARVPRVRQRGETGDDMEEGLSEAEDSGAEREG
jgi:hypothetical protein